MVAAHGSDPHRAATLTVRLLTDVAGVRTAIRAGDYLELDGEKAHEALFEAYEGSVTR